jgi:hypothetical protein
MEFQQMIHSTGGLMSSTTQFLVHTACIPITVPMKKTSSLVLGTANFVGGIFSNMTEKAFSSVETILFQNSASSNHDPNDHELMIQQHCNHFLKAISSVTEFLIHVVPDVNIDVLGLMHASTNILLPWQGSSQEGDNSADQSIRDGSASLIGNSDETSDHDGNNFNPNSLDCSSKSIRRSKHDVSTFLGHQEDTDKVSPVGQLFYAKITDRSDRHASRGFAFRVRVCDLDIPPSENSSSLWKNQFYYLTCQKSDEEHLCPSYGNAADTVVDKLVELALLLASHDDEFQLDMDFVSSSSPRNGKTMSKTHVRMVSPRIQWKQEGMTTKLLRKMQTKFNWNKTLDLLEKEVLVWSGSMKDKSSSCYGHGIPIFKARGIIANMNTVQLLELFMDSTKVKLYNKHSNGRKDIGKVPCRNGVVCKVVENQTKVPFSNKIISMTTMLHARKIPGSDCDFITVSRSVELGRNRHSKQDASSIEVDEAAFLPGARNEILWGINVIRQVPGCTDKVDLTTITQANSSAIPGFLAHKLGLKCVEEFLKNLRVIPREAIITKQLPPFA